MCVVMVATFIRCDKKQPSVPDYGVSITAPVMGQGSRFLFTMEQINLLRSSNGLAFKFLPHLLPADTQDVPVRLFSPIAFLYGLSCRSSQDTILDDIIITEKYSGDSLCHYHIQLLELFKQAENLDFSFSAQPFGLPENERGDTLLITQKISLRGTLPLNTFQVIPFFTEDSLDIVEIPMQEDAFSILIFKPLNNFQTFVNGLSEKRFFDYCSRLSPYMVEILGESCNQSSALNLYPVLQTSGLETPVSGNPHNDSLERKKIPLSIALWQEIQFEYSTRKNRIPTQGDKQLVSEVPVFKLFPPYLFFVKEQSTNAILLLGICT